jgi:hypothetical protein
MTSQEFVTWLKGFMEACNDLTATPKQWDSIKEELEKVSDGRTSSLHGSIGIMGGSTTVTQYPPGTNVNYTQLID